MKRIDIKQLIPQRAPILMVDELLNAEELSLWLIDYLQEYYPGCLKERYGAEEGKKSLEVLEEIARIRSCRLKGDELDLAKASALLIDDFRNGRIGKISLEFPGMTV